MALSFNVDRTQQLKARTARAVMLSVLLPSAIFLAGCLDRGSDTSREVEVIAGFPSPNQSYVATSYNTSGGGAAGWCYLHVNVRQQSEQFHPDRGVVFQTRCNVKPELKWVGEKKLSITYPRDSTIYTQENAWGSGDGVEISHVTK